MLNGVAAINRQEEIELFETIARIDERTNNLPCRREGGCSWSLKQKAIVGTGLTGAIASIIMSIIDKIGGK